MGRKEERREERKDERLGPIKEQRESRERQANREKGKKSFSQKKQRRRNRAGEERKKRRRKKQKQKRDRAGRENQCNRKKSGRLGQHLGTRWPYVTHPMPSTFYKTGLCIKVNQLNPQLPLAMCTKAYRNHKKLLGTKSRNIFLRLQKTVKL